MEQQKKLIEVGAFSFDLGYWQGIRQPTARVVLTLIPGEVDPNILREFDSLNTSLFTPESSTVLNNLIGREIVRHSVLGRILMMALAILQKIGMPIMGGTTAVKLHSRNDLRRWIVALPAIAEDIRAPQAAFNLACALMNELADAKSIKNSILQAEIEKLTKQFRPQAPSGVNTLRFLQAAHELNIPWRHVANNVYQFGWGRLSRWLDSSFTDRTSRISAGLARDKLASLKILRHAGLPVSRHQLVNSVEQAIKVSGVLGYPVVLKPADLDGGRGVFAGLRDDDEVAKAFSKVSALTKRVLVEKFIEGNDYRIRVCDGEVIGVVIRKAASVIGDGTSSVHALIERINNERSKLTTTLELETEQGSKPIVVDDEVKSWLAAQGLTLESVLPRGKGVRLRGAANINLGGTTWDVTREAHPDNVELALQAAAALRLDIAGVDLLMADIGCSWKESGGAICEVNSQPQFSSGPMHRIILERLVRHQGRIPVVGIVLACIDSDNLRQIVEKLNHQDLRVYLANTSLECYRLLQKSDADAVIWQIATQRSPAAGMPIDRLNLLLRPSEAVTAASLLPLSIDATWLLNDPSATNTMCEQLQTYLYQTCSKI